MNSRILLFLLLVMLGYGTPLSVVAESVARSHVIGLLDAYYLSVENDAEFATSQADYESAQESLVQARSRLLPQISVGADVRRVNEELKVTSGIKSKHSESFDGRGYSLSIRQPIYRKGDFINYGQSKYQMSQSEIVYSKARQELITRFLKAYLDLSNKIENYQLWQAQSDAFLDELDRAKLGESLGTARSVDRYEAQASYDFAQADLIFSQNEVESARLNLSKILNADVNSVAVLGAVNPVLVVDMKNVDYWIDNAITNNFDIKIAQYALKINSEEVTRYKAELMPTLDIVGSAFKDNEMRQQETEQTRYELSLKLEIPIFTGGYNTSKIREARAQEKSSQYTLEGTKRDAIKLAEDTFYSIKKIKARIEALEGAQSSTERALISSRDGLKLGVRTMVDVLNAQRRLYDIRRDLVNEKYRFISEQIQLLATSGLLTETHINDLDRLIAVPGA